MIRDVTFEAAGGERGVVALDAVGPNDWIDLDAGRFETTNTPDVRVGWSPSPPTLGDVEATLREATQYDDLLRRLAD